MTAAPESKGGGLTNEEILAEMAKRSRNVSLVPDADYIATATRNRATSAVDEQHGDRENNVSVVRIPLFENNQPLAELISEGRRQHGELAHEYNLLTLPVIIYHNRKSISIPDSIIERELIYYQTTSGVVRSIDLKSYVFVRGESTNDGKPFIRVKTSSMIYEPGPNNERWLHLVLEDFDREHQANK